MSHSLIIQKLAKYGADDNTVSLIIIKDYLRGHKQLIKNVGLSQREPANRCSEKDEEVASFKAARKAL